MLNWLKTKLRGEDTTLQKFEALRASIQALLQQEYQKVDSLGIVFHPLNNHRLAERLLLAVEYGGKLLFERKEEALFEFVAETEHIFYASVQHISPWAGATSRLVRASLERANPSMGLIFATEGNEKMLQALMIFPPNLFPRGKLNEIMRERDKRAIDTMKSLRKSE